MVPSEGKSILSWKVLTLRSATPTKASLQVAMAWHGLRFAMLGQPGVSGS